ncbi:gag-pol polyprotein [Cucumis melo var. makuwa]|uniref:Gag-pol polyprotein n=1 Tax=Cucumis melo var. makuwa TaxID=1194695 RepID=A0A5A7VDW6_CUCMM|nr:gag-pol polyprotein [Cucumis melo var. makuwa]TYK27124.1 gag-pol polyprotein [Cucumis melo var. makuwa]
MDIIREGSSTNRPPVLDGSNCAYWKARMISFLKSVDSKTRKAVVLDGSIYPIVILTDADKKVSTKPKLSWSSVDDEAPLRSSCALNAIFND